MPTMTSVAAAILGIAAGLNGGGGAVGPQLPQQGNLVTRFNADSITPQSDGSALASWTDQIGGVVAAQATGVNQPTYVASGKGGKAGVKVNGSQWLDIVTPGNMATVLATANFTVLIAVSDTTAATNGAVFGARLSGNGHFYTNSGTVIGRFINGDISVPAQTPLNFHTFGWQSTSGTTFSGSFQRGFVDGGIFSQGAGGAAFTATADYGIGASSGTGTFPSKCTIYQIFVWSVALTPSEIYQAEAYLRNYYSQATPWSSTAGIVLFDGDSITANQQPANNTVVQGYPYQAAAALGLIYGQWSMVAVSGISLGQLVTKVPELAGIPAVINKRIVVAAWEYYNSRGNTGAANYATAVSLVAAYKALYANIRVVWGTSISHTVEPDTNRVDYNTLMDTTPVGDQYVQLHLLPHIGIQGGADLNPTYYGTDLIHPKPLGYSELYPAFVTPVSTAIAMA